MSEALRHQVGKLFIVGLEGTALTAVERTWLRLIRPGGIILFRRNIEEAAQTAALLREATETIGAPIFRCVDIEGGLVDRLRDLIAPMPSAAAVFTTGKPALYKQHGRLIAQEARLLGFNTVFAPVLDLALPESSAVMRTRVVSPNPRDVITYASGFLDGLEAEGVLGCGKHFPGLGGGNLDSHHATPVIQRSWDIMWNEDIAPFRALAPRLPMIMASHAIYPKASNERKSASTSAFWISEILRRKMKYKGLVVSDDMEMGGILTQQRIEDAVIAAVSASTDVVEICKDPALVLNCYEALLAEAEKSTPFRQRIIRAFRRICEVVPPRQLFALPAHSRIRGLREKVKVFSDININSFSSSVL
jgi:beta-N-acetylhexosaminidase